MEPALGSFRRVLALEPGNQDAQLRVVLCLARMGKVDEARRALEQAFRLKPDSPEAHHRMAVTLRACDCGSTCNAEYRRALELDPVSPPCLNNFAWLLATNPNQAYRNGTEAVALAEKACS